MTGEDEVTGCHAADGHDAAEDPAVDLATRRDYLRRVPLFRALNDTDLADLLARADELELAPGHELFHEGAVGDSLYVVLSGEVEVSRRVRDVEDVIATRRPGEFVGEMALVNGKPRTATVGSSGGARLLRIGPEGYRDMLRRSPDAAAAVVACMSDRIEEDQANRAREERLVALGTVAAGLAHELNNPAAALARSRVSLGEAHDARDLAATDLFSRKLTDAEREGVVSLGSLARQFASRESVRTGRMPAQEAEDALTEYLQDLGLERPWDAAPDLLQAGWTLDAIEDALSMFDPLNRVAAARWMAADAVARGLLVEIGVAADAIVEQVRAVKVASHLDRARYDRVDVHEGLESALVMVKRKIGSGVTVVRDYASDVPAIDAYPGELNQAWTNLIDNALDAMAGDGVLTLRTRGGPEQVTVEISDTGPGIPADVLPRLFQPYFTTKDVGHGTGLGLPLVRTTIEERHGGRVTVRSAPGATVFRVTLPTTRHRHSVAAS